PVPFDFDNTGMTARVWSPEAGVIVKLKVEQVGAPGIFVEQDVLTTTSGAWETLVFNFATPVAGGLNLDQDYDLVTIFFNFGADPGTTPEQTYFFDDIDFAPGVGGFIPTALPIDFDTPDVTFGLFDFGGNVSTVIPDPEDAGNNVVQSIRTAGAATFAGTTVPTGGLTDRIPFEDGVTALSVRVWSPEVGVPVRMKLEATGSPGLVAEKEIATSTSGEWETMVFDFSVDALVPVDINADYDIVTLFFNFDADPATTPEQTYLWDDIQIAVGGPAPCQNPYPQVNPASLNATILASGKLRFEWEPIEGQIGCQINIVVGSGPQQTSKIVGGATANSFTAPANQLVAFTTYNFRVRCGCSQSPLIAGPYTPFASVLYIPPAIIEETGDAYADSPLSQIDGDAQWSNANLNTDVIGDLFAMAASDSWVRVAPNPAQDNVNLSYNSLSEGQGFIRVFDAQGKLAFERVITFNKGLNNVNLNMNELENGIYIVEVLQGESRESVRLLMQ
ncbi:MAG: T9SS type A sorting domain-containing protein, partial [Cryomorphaceae bacterium]